MLTGPNYVEGTTLKTLVPRGVETTKNAPIAGAYLSRNQACSILHNQADPTGVKCLIDFR